MVFFKTRKIKTANTGKVDQVNLFVMMKYELSFIIHVARYYETEPLNHDIE